MAHRLRPACGIAAVTLALCGAAAGADDAGKGDSPIFVAFGDKNRDRPPVEPTRGAVIRLEGFLGPGNEEYLRRKLETARAHHAKVVIVEIESPGGRVDSSRAIAEMLCEVRWARTVAFIPRYAFSGAAISALGCDEIVMTPEAMLGDAGEIAPDRNSQFRYVPEKVLSVLIEFVRTLAESKGRPPALAEAMVDMKTTVYRVRNLKTGETTYKSQREIDEDPEQWKKLGAVAQTGKGRFFTVNGRKAVDLGLARGLAARRGEVVARYCLDGDLLVLEPGGIDTLVQILNSPWITGLLLVLGLTGLYLEFSSPGIGFGGLLAAGCFTIFFWSHFFGNPDAWLAVVLFLLGVAFVGVELFILPGFAVAGLAGAILIIASVVLAIQGFFIPQSAQDLNTLTQTMLVIFLSGLAFAVAAVFISKRFGSLPLFRRLVLAPPEPALAGGGAGRAAAEAPAGLPAELPVAVGRIGIAQSTLRPGGKARFGNQYVDVVTDGTFITKGSRVRIVEITGNRVVVSEPEEQE
jgi:membrane-bound serine protease (ClpP class)